jgi:molybdopterin converting factor small subunit
MVEIRIIGALWEHLEPKMKLDLNGDSVTVADLLARLRIDEAEVGIVTVDGRQGNLDWIIPADARVFIFPPMLGG